jgi:hypothetical protein
MITLQNIRNHFAHAKLTFSFSSNEVAELITLFHRSPGAELVEILGNRRSVLYVISMYYFVLDTYAAAGQVTHGL